jgi:hypothetical protein
VRFKFRGVTVESVKNQSRSELRRAGELNREMLDAVPRLNREGHIQFGGLGKLAAQGWTADEVNRVVDAFPDAPYLTLTMAVSLAGAIRQQGVPQVDDVIDWLRRSRKLARTVNWCRGGSCVKRLPARVDNTTTWGCRQYPRCGPRPRDHHRLVLRPLRQGSLSQTRPRGPGARSRRSTKRLTLNAVQRSTQHAAVRSASPMARMRA